MLSLVQCGHAYEHPEGLTIDRPQGTDFYVFVYFRTPSEVFTAGAWQAAQYHFILFSPGTPQLYRSVTAPYINDWVHFSCDKPDEWISQIGLPLNTVTPFVDPMKIAHSVENLQELLLVGDAINTAHTAAELQSLCYWLAAPSRHSGSQQKPTPYTAMLAGIRSQLYSLPQAHVSVKELADQAGVSISHFQSIYKQCFGVPIGSDMIQSRIERACYLLKSGTYSVSEVGRMSGYQCDAHFIRQFKKKMGETPGRYLSNG